MSIDKRSLLEARLKLNSLSVQDYLKQLELRDMMVERLQNRLKMALDGLDTYALKYPEDDTASKAILEIMEETKK